MRGVGGQKDPNVACHTLWTAPNVINNTSEDDIVIHVDNAIQSANGEVLIGSV